MTGRNTPTNAVPLWSADSATRTAFGEPCPRCGTRTVLSQAQHGLLALIADGLTRLEISRRLKLTERQVARRTILLLRWLGARNQAQAVDIGCRAGLLRLRADLRPIRVTVLQRYVLLALGRGHTRPETVELLGIGRAALNKALSGIQRALGLADRRLRTRLLLYLLHSLQALPEGHPCRCHPDEALASPQELACLRAAAALPPDPPDPVYGRPCPRCEKRTVLTPALHQTLTLVACGATNEEIGLALGGGREDGVHHISALRTEFDAKSRAQIVDRGWCHGFLDPPTVLPDVSTGLDNRDSDAMIEIADGSGIERAAQSVQLTTRTLVRRLRDLHTRLGTTGHHHTVEAVHILHALGGVLPNHHPCECRRGQAA
ncbi:hypothetical protein ACFVUH_08040 [Kitasatospora sp. NPDC058032]|uniref:hypothetical protein n=1 Tax=Kitasatospora sp. NPDC058032 TaxID=3346307 RepID=UPI0036D8D7DF